MVLAALLQMAQKLQMLALNLHPERYIYLVEVVVLGCKQLM
jgi:hypothetical protein